MEKIKTSSLTVFTEIPIGWSVVKGSLTAPNGYEFINNGESRFSHKYQCGLIKCEPVLQRASEGGNPIVQKNKSISPTIDKSEKGPGICFSDESDLPNKLNQLSYGGHDGRGAGGGGVNGMD